MKIIFCLVPPRVTPFFFEDNPVHEGQYIQVNCLVSEGDLPLEINWDLNGVDVESINEISSSKIGKRSSILTIESVTYTNAGNYTCTARNQAGASNHVALLLVNGYQLFQFFSLFLSKFYLASHPSTSKIVPRKQDNMLLFNVRYLKEIFLWLFPGNLTTCPFKTNFGS